MDLKTIREVNFSGKKVIMRVDFNVPMNSAIVQDDTRIKAALNSINYILEQKPRYLILMSHLGDPKKDLKKAKEKSEKEGKILDEEAFINGKNKLKPVAEYLSKLLGIPVLFIEKTTGISVETLCNQSPEHSIIMLENTRFDSRETSKEEHERKSMAKELAQLAEVYVNDAFGTAHRAHASTETLAHFLPAYAGFLMEKEVTYLDPIVTNPQKPMVAIVGGAKVSSKLAVLESLLKNADTLIIGGGMAFTFLKAQGHNVGKSLIETDFIETAQHLLKTAKEKNISILLPVDHLAAPSFADVSPVYIENVDIPDDLMGLDAGKKSIELYKKALKGAKTVIWNGPLGVFEFKNFEFGTHEIAKAIAEIKDNNGVSVVGGGDSVAAINKFKLADKMSHVSTGGGASLEYLEGKILPGIVALKR